MGKWVANLYPQQNNCKPLQLTGTKKRRTEDGEMESWSEREDVKKNDVVILCHEVAEMYVKYEKFT